MSEELKNCPFCGSEATMQGHDKQHDWIVGCTGCGAQTDNDGETYLSAIDAWNQRTASEVSTLLKAMQEIADLDCSEGFKAVAIANAAIVKVAVDNVQTD